VQVVDDKNERRASREGPEQLCHGVEQSIALLLRGKRYGLWQIEKPLSQLGHDLCHDSTEAAELFAQRVDLGFLGVGGNRLGEGPERPSEPALETATPQHPRADSPRPRGELLEHAGLPDPRLSDQDREAAASRPRRLESLLELPELPPAAGKGWPRELLPDGRVFPRVPISD